MSSGAPASLIVRPVVRHHSAWTVAALVLGSAVVLVLVVLPFESAYGRVAAGVCAGSVWAALIIGTRWWRRTATLTVHDDMLIYRGLRNARVAGSRGAGRTLRVRVEPPASPAIDYRLWLDDGGDCLVKLAESEWDVHQLDELGRQLEIPNDDLEEALTLKETARTFPGFMRPWWAWCLTHPHRVSAATVLLLVAGIVLASLVLALADALGG